MIHLALFASGTGSNVENLVKYFHLNHAVKISLLVSNNASCGAVQIAKKSSVPVLVLDKDQITDGDFIVQELEKRKINYIVLAGYLRKIPVEIIRAFPDKIINIHPSLLPRYGGKGMYGKHVHEAVANAGERESGITIHFVNEEYDKGRIIEQKKVNLPDWADAEEVEKRVRQLEMQWFPKIVEATVLNK